MKKQNSFMVVAAVCGALLAGPAFAQGAPAGGGAIGLLFGLPDGITP